MNNSFPQSLLVIITTIAIITVNVLANFLPINDLTTGEISSFYPVSFTPAGYVFTIWSVIYLSLLIFSGYQWFLSKRQEVFSDSELNLSNVKWLYIVSGVLNISWILAWHYLQIELSVIIMLGLLGTLIAMYQTLISYRLQGLDYWFLQFPFSLYLGWISVATVANATVLFYDWNLMTESFIDIFWTVGLIGLVSVLTHIVLWRKQDLVYAGVIIWSMVGIIVANRTEPFLIVMALLAITTILYHMGRYLVTSSVGTSYSEVSN